MNAHNNGWSALNLVIAIESLFDDIDHGVQHEAILGESLNEVAKDMPSSVNDLPYATQVITNRAGQIFEITVSERSASR